MWEIKNNQQVFSFVISVIFGVGYCLFYDVFRSCRRVFKSNTAAVFFGDIIFFVIIAFVTYLLLLALCSGELRGYMFFGILLGSVVCNFTLSRLTLKLFPFIIGNFLKVFLLLKNIFTALNSKILRLISKVTTFFVNFFKKTTKYLKNVLKRKV